MKTATEAYSYADKNGFKYKRSHLGSSIYADQSGRILEIGAGQAALLSPASADGRKSRANRIIAVWRFK